MTRSLSRSIPAKALNLEPEPGRRASVAVAAVEERPLHGIPDHPQALPDQQCDFRSARRLRGARPPGVLRREVEHRLPASGSNGRSSGRARSATRPRACGDRRHAQPPGMLFAAQPGRAVAGEVDGRTPSPSRCPLGIVDLESPATGPACRGRACGFRCFPRPPHLEPHANDSRRTACRARSRP